MSEVTGPSEPRQAGVLAGIRAWFTNSPTRPTHPGDTFPFGGPIASIAGLAVIVIAILDPRDWLTAWYRVGAASGGLVVVAVGAALISFGSIASAGLGPRDRLSLQLRAAAGIAYTATALVATGVLTAWFVLSTPTSGGATVTTPLVSATLPSTPPSLAAVAAPLSSDSVAVRIAAIADIRLFMLQQPQYLESAGSMLADFISTGSAIGTGTACEAPYAPEVVATEAPFAERQPDIVAAVDVLLRFNFTEPPLEFRDSRLRIATFNGAVLTGLDARSADLSFSSFADADLRQADFSRTFPGGCRSHLEQVSFVRADLTGADLSRTILDRTTFSQACLAGTDFSEASIPSTVWSGASYDENTRWPDGFDPTTAGLLLRACP